MPSVYVSSGIEEGACYGFPPGDQVFIVGRAPNCHIVLTDPLISRQHCRIERVGPAYKVVDLGSHNGVYLNEEKLAKDSEREIKFGDSIRLGETELVLQEGAPDDEGELAGRRLGAYQLVKRIGSGGMGEVYRAVQIALGRPVAIKILSPELTEDSSFVERFMTEARAAGKLNHPNVVQVHEVGEADGIYYYSMEYLAGGSVQDQIRGGRKLTAEKAVKIVLGAAKALEYAEKQGVIHCDIKPDNLMLTEDGEVRLADLGIARTVASRGAKVKQEGGVLGSPHYMAPEQARGEAIDRRVDIYSLGATFYRLLAGRTPFTGKNAREIMEKQVYEEPPGLRSLDPNIPLEAARIAGKMMKKRPDKRYQSAREAVIDLTKLLESLAPKPSGSGELAAVGSVSARRRRARKSAGVGAVLLILVAILAVAALLLYSRMSGRDGAPDPQTLLERAEDAERRGDLKSAHELYKSVIKATEEGSAIHSLAVARATEIWKELTVSQSDQPGEREWRELSELAGKGQPPRALAERYEKFIKDFPDSPRAGEARLAAQQQRTKFNEAADAAVKELEGRQASMLGACRYAELRNEWERLAASLAGSPGGDRAAKLARELEALPDKELAAARKSADARLAAGELDAVLPDFDRFLKADLPEVAAQAAALVETYKARIAAVREERSKAEELKRRAAACKLIAGEAEKLARDYQYIPARFKFAEAAMAYAREGLGAEADAVRKLADEYQKEYGLLNRLIDYADSGRLASARVRLADGLAADVVSIDPEKLTYTRGMSRNASVPWKDVPTLSVYGLLRRPALSTEERLTLASFALRRGLNAEAREELERILKAEPDRKAEVAPLLEAAEKALQGTPAPQGEGGGAPGAEKAAEEPKGKPE